jgi:peptidyl-prolyl cis-trans isomerase D
VKARHILLKLSPDASESEASKVKEKILAVLKQVKEGEDFAEAAKKHSQGPSAPEGGDLGYFSKGQMVKPFEDLAFSLRKGEIGGPVRTDFGWHIIKVEDNKEMKVHTLAEVHDQIETDLKKAIASDLARERMLALMDQMPYDIDLSAYARQHGLTVKESDYFPKDGPIPGLGKDEKLSRSINSLEKNEVSEVIEHDGKFHIVQIVDQKESYIPKRDDVSDQLNKDLADHLAVVAAKTAAEECLKELKGGADWSELAKNKGVQPEETGFFTRGGAIPKIGYRTELLEAAFSLSAQNRYPEQAFEVNKKAYVVRWSGKKDIDQKEFEKEKKNFTQYLIAAKQERIFNAWLQSLKDKAEIKIVSPLE